MCGSDLELDTLRLRLRLLRLDMVVLRLAAAKGLARTLAMGLALARGLSPGLTLCLGSLCEFKFASCAVAGVAFN